MLLCSFLEPISLVWELDLQILWLLGYQQNNSSPTLTHIIPFYAMGTLQILGMGGCT
jgi:hypothetical protein